MFHRKLLCAFTACAALVAADSASWNNKPIADWTEDDARLVLDDSPWSKTVQPTFERSSNSGQRPSPGLGRGGGMGRGGINLGGIGIGLPGTRGAGRRGSGYPGGGYPGGQPRGDSPRSAGDRELPNLRLRWESALPVRAAGLKIRDSNPPTIDENHYALAVYGVPDRFAGNDSRSFAKELKSKAALKREGKPDIRPSSVEVLQRPGGPVIVYLFPRTKEITSQDKYVELDAQIGRLQIARAFFLEDMTYQGKLEL